MFLISYTLIGLIVYLIFINKMESILKNEGGYRKFVQKALESKDKELEIFPDNWHNAIINTGTLIFILIGWPFFLYSTVKMFFKSEEQSLEEFKNKLEE